VDDLGYGQYLHGSDEEAVGLREQGDDRPEFNLQDRK
jgi:hypothetical protein